MQQLPKLNASETAMLWEAVGGQPLGGALAEMGSRGWTYTAAINGNTSGAMMKRGNRRAGLYARNGKVGMIVLSETAK